MPKEPFPLKIDKKILEWVREQAQSSNRSVNNFIETELKKLMQDSEFQKEHIGQ
jgi:hypothetical protein